MREKVESGLYDDASVVVQDALRPLDERYRRDRLRAAIAVGLEDVARGRSSIGGRISWNARRSKRPKGIAWGCRPTTSSRSFRVVARARRYVRAILCHSFRFWGNDQRDAYAARLAAAIDGLADTPILVVPERTWLLGCVAIRSGSMSSPTRATPSP